MAFKKSKKNASKVINRDLAGLTERAGIVTVQNYYEASPSGVQWRDRVVSVQERDDSRPTKLPRLHSPPPIVHSPPHVPDRDSTPLPLTPAQRGARVGVSPKESVDGRAFEGGQTDPPLSDGVAPPSVTFDTESLPPPLPPASSRDPSQIRHKKAAREKLDEAGAHIPLMLRCLLEREAHSAIPGPCQLCGRRPALHRCRDCSEPPALCVACMCETHCHAPYHWVEEWIQPHPDNPKRFFQKRDLSELGLVHYLGHQGRRCGQVSSGTPEIHTLVITHVNGIHTVRVEYCECSSPRRRSREEQLVLAGLIPASFQKLQSAFTVEVLEDAHEDILASRKSPYDYMRKLRRRTSNCAAHKVTDRYREFLHVFRLWRFMKMVKRSGSCHGLRYPGRDPNLLTVPCFACPWPGVNLPVDFRSTDSDMQYIYRLFLGADGNYSLQKKTKPSDDTDYSLVGDNGFFNDVSQLKDFLKKYPKEDWKILVTCSGFKVTRSQRVGKFKNLDVSGVISITCTRHGCFRARGTCDMPGGEAYPLLDLALSGALETAEDLLEWLLTYDVGCQYIANLLARWKEWDLPEKFLHIVENLRILLPQMHMLAHQESCQTDYCMGFKQGTGHTCGEMVETIWAEHNAIGLSTREMNGGARRDALNDFFNSWNWYKNEGRAKYLHRKLTEKLLLQLQQTRDLAALTQEAGPQEIQDWLTMDIDDQPLTPATYHCRPPHRPPSVYILDAAKVPSKGSALDELLGRVAKPSGTGLSAALSRIDPAVPLGDPHTTAAPSSSLTSPPLFRTMLPASAVMCLKNGVELEYSQEDLRRRVELFRRSVQGKGGVSSENISQLGASRRALGDSIDEWRKEMHSALPELASEDDGTCGYGGLLCEEDLEDPDLPHDGPETQPLGLPSDWEWGTDSRDSSLTRAALAELKLRTGHAYDLLASIRMALRKKGALLEEKEKHARGQKEHTRGQQKIKGVQDQARFLADVYNKNLERMRNLRMPAQMADPTTDIPPALRSIDKSRDLTIPPTRRLHNTGDTQRQLPWIFQPAGPQTLSAEAGEQWETECRRTDWFRAWAAKRRTDEEVNLLYADGKAARRGFLFASRLWDNSGDVTGDGRVTEGAAAYATQKSWMFSVMAHEVEESVREAHRLHVAAIAALQDDDDEGLRRVYNVVQAPLTPSDDRLDYGLSIRPLINQSQSAEMWTTVLSIMKM